MGERAVAAVEGQNGECACYHSQWGGSRSAIHSVFEAGPDEHPATPLTVYDWQYRRRQRWSTVVETLDYLQFEVVYRLSKGGVAVYLPLWLGFETAGLTDPETGVLVRVTSPADFVCLAARIREWKSQLGERVENGCLRLDVAQRTLCERLTGREWIGPESVTDSWL